MTGRENPLKDAALGALQLGRSVMPVSESGEYAKKPHFVLTETGHVKDSSGPLAPGWKRLQTELATPENVETWFRNPRGKGVAVVTGMISGLVILDFDGEQGQQLVGRLNLRPHVRTGSGGYHVYFRHPGHQVPTLNSKAKQKMGVRWPGLDIRADGGYAIMPPSRNASGPYVQLRDLADLDDISVLPRELQEYLHLVEVEAPARPVAAPARTPAGTYRQDGQGRVSTDRLLDQALGKVGQEGRNNAGFGLAGQLRDNGYSQGEAAAVMQEYVQQVPGHNTKGQAEAYGMNDALASLASAYNSPAREPWTARERTEPTAIPAGSQVQGSSPTAPAPALPDAFTLPELPDLGSVVVVPHNLRSDVTAALRLYQAEAMTVRTAEELSEEYLIGLRRDQRNMYVVRPTPQLQQTLNRAGVVWDAIDLEETADPEVLLANLLAQIDGLLERQVQGDREYLLKDFPELLNRRASGQQVIYPTGLPALDAALGGGFYPGLHVLGGVTAGGKTAMALHIAESNARAGRPVIFVTYEQSRAELWTRLLSPALGIGVSTFRAGRTTEGSLGQRLQEDARYQDIADTVAPHLRVYEGDAADRSQQWGIDRLSGEIARLKAFYDGRPPLVILDYLQRMPPEADADKRHQIDSLVMALQVRLGRQLETPILLLSSVSRGNYGELLTTPLEERLGVFKESGGIEYTAYSATLLYPFALKDATGYELPPVPGSPTAALKGLWRYIVADLVKNREGEAGLQLLLKWWPKQARYEVVGPLDPQEFTSGSGMSRKSTR